MTRLNIKACLLFFPALSLAVPANAAGQGDGAQSDMATYFYNDFTSETLDGFATYDLDGQTLHFSMSQAGFKQGDAWIAKRETRTQNYYAASGSKYKYADGETPRQSDDWLVTPAVRIRGGNAVLSWRGNSVCDQTKNTSGYKVLVSTKGGKPEDFTDEPLCTVTDEPANKWTDHEVSLAQYAGKTIYVAFVNNSLEKEILGIDDIRLFGEKGLCELTVNTGGWVFGQDAVNVEATVTAYSDVPVTEITAYYAYKGQTFTKRVTGISLKNRESVSFSFDDKIPVQLGDTVHYELWAEVNGQLQEKISCQTVAFMFKPHRRTVIEEGTGMWCTYCPKGIVAMETLADKYPDEFIGLALHYDDPMAVDDYVSALKFPGFPSGWVNRKFMVEDPMVLVEENGVNRYTTMNGGFETYFLQAQQEPALADLSLDTEVCGNTIKLTAVTRFAIGRPSADYCLAFAIIEDGVTDPLYYQENGFSEGTIEMGGYELLPPRILPAVFNHVARGIYSDYRGVQGSVPAVVEAGKDYSFDYTIDVPPTVKSLNNAKVVAMLVDQTTGEIVNANISSALATGITDAKAGNFSLVCRNEGGQCCVDIALPSAAPAVVSLFTAEGRLVSQSSVGGRSGSHSLRIPVAGRSGMHIVTVAHDGNTVSKKIYLY